MKQSLNVMLQQQLEKNVCIDEQIIPFKGQLGLKQYMKGKPNPWGIKIFFLCGEFSMPFNFIAYQEKTTSLPEKHLPLGLSGGIVMSLVEGRLIHCSDYRLFLTISLHLLLWYNSYYRKEYTVLEQCATTEWDLYPSKQMQS